MNPLRMPTPRRYRRSQRAPLPQTLFLQDDVLQNWWRSATCERTVLQDTVLTIVNVTAVTPASHALLPPRASHAAGGHRCCAADSKPQPPPSENIAAHRASRNRQPGNGTPVSCSDTFQRRMASAADSARFGTAASFGGPTSSAKPPGP